MHRLPESKYKPIGRRVPYPETAGSPDLPSTPSPYATVGAGSSAYGTATRSTAFVNDSDQAIQDSAVYTPPASVENVSIGNAETSSDRSNSGQSGVGSSEPVVSVDANYSGTNYSDSAADQPKSAAEPLFKIARPFVDKLTDKSAKKKKVTQDRKVGDDWGELRTAEHRNSWDVDENSGRDEGGFFDFIKGGASRSTPQNAPTYDPRYADNDLDSGWENFEGQGGYQRDNYPSAPVDDRDRRVYSDGLYGNEQPYADVNMSAGPEEGPVERYEADYQESYEEGFEESYEEGFEENGVYDADYRVIVPPSKPLDDDATTSTILHR